MKIMKAKLSEDNEFLKRFIQEYGLVSKIECRHVVRIYDQGVTDRHVYIAMEYFAGGDLRARHSGGTRAGRVAERCPRRLAGVCRLSTYRASCIAI
jgi:serine/threonine protein kinase